MNRNNLKSATTLRAPAELVAHGLAPVAALPDLQRVAARYAVAVTAEIAALIDPDDPNDPIARQFIPSAEELATETGENADPIGDHAHSPVAGIVHRYPDRVLFKLVHVCAVYCRFCFRREMVGPGKATALSPGAHDGAIGYIRAHPEIWEVVLTGGDPLMLSPRRLGEIMAELAGIDHVKIIRIHTRVPVADPARISGEMVAALRVAGAVTWVALHANHARELTANARAACAAFVDAGIPMVSQTVLLRGVNDNPAALEKLMRAFVECRVN
jgi:lysine 2,3-aminomutase